MLPFGGTIDGTNESASASIQVKSAVRFGVGATVGVEISLSCCCCCRSLRNCWLTPSSSSNEALLVDAQGGGSSKSIMDMVQHVANCMAIDA